MKRKVKTIALFCTLVVLLSTMFVGYAANQTALIVDGETSTIEMRAINGNTYVPLRSFCQQMGDCTITWNGKSEVATVTSKGLSMTVDADLNYVEANGRYFYMLDGVYCGNGALFLPVTLLAKLFNSEVHWTADHQALQVTRKGGSLKSADAYYDSTDLYWLSRIIYAESGGEPLEGKIAVGNVVLNRVDNSRFPTTVYNVIFQKNQFSPVSSGSIYRTPSAESVVAAKIALEGYEVAQDSLFFLNRSIARSRWMEKNCTYVATIGRHTFYTLAS